MRYTLLCATVFSEEDQGGGRGVSTDTPVQEISCVTGVCVLVTVTLVDCVVVFTAAWDTHITTHRESTQDSNTLV